MLGFNEENFTVLNTFSDSLSCVDLQTIVPSSLGFRQVGELQYLVPMWKLARACACCIALVYICCKNIWEQNDFVKLVHSM